MAAEGLVAPLSSRDCQPGASRSRTGTRRLAATRVHPHLDVPASHRLQLAKQSCVVGAVRGDLSKGPSPVDNAACL